MGKKQGLGSENSEGWDGFVQFWIVGLGTVHHVAEGWTRWGSEQPSIGIALQVREWTAEYWNGIAGRGQGLVLGTVQEIYKSHALADTWYFLGVDLFIYFLVAVPMGVNGCDLQLHFLDN